jgi:thiamine biosynthesis lipoprotein ApbE
MATRSSAPFLAAPALSIGRACGVAFDIGAGDAVRGRGLVPVAADPRAIRAPVLVRGRPAHEVRVHDGRRARKAAPIAGDYRHRATVGGRQRAHSMDPARGARLRAPLASVSMIAPGRAEADARAAALMAAGAGLDARLLARDDAGGVQWLAVGRISSARTAAMAPSIGE